MPTFPLFSIHSTADGSPTLRLMEKTDQGLTVGEAMHNLNGALAETLYVYLPVLEKAFSWNLIETRFISVGLGLGYNELMSTTFALTLKRPQVFWKLASYENKKFLRDAFLSWLRGCSPREDLSTRLHLAYQQILHDLSEKFEVSSPLIVKELLKKWTNGSWTIENEFHVGIEPPFLAHGIFYDPFSSRTQPELWNESNLLQILQQIADSPCVFSTYAATGSLKKILKHLDFDVNIIKGFGGKRHSTIAYRFAGFLPIIFGFFSFFRFLSSSSLAI